MKILIVLQMSLCFFVHAQNSLFTGSEITYGALSSEQSLRYDKLVNDSIFSSIYFITTAKLDSTTIDTTGKVLISLPGYLDRDFVYTLNNFDLTDSSNFVMGGTEYIPPTDVSDSLRDGHSDFLLVKSEGIYVGHFTLAGEGYEYYDLTEGIQVLCHLNRASLASQVCAGGTGDGGDPTTGELSSDCDDKVIKILVLYTPSAHAVDPNVAAKAAAGVYDLQQIWNNSAVGYNISMATSALPFTFFETYSNITGDVNSLAANTTVQGLRSTYNAEIVVLLTGGQYAGADGIVKELGASFSGAYCIVDVATAITGRHTFAHEVSHLFNARHQDDPTANNTHAHDYWTGQSYGIGGCHRYTLMNTLTDVRMPYVSNKDVWNYGVPTGNSFHNNAEDGIAQWQNTIAQYGNDVNNPQVDVHRVNCTSDYNYWHAKITGFCPTVDHGPYTIKWYKCPMQYFLQAYNQGVSAPWTYLTSGNNQWIFNNSFWVMLKGQIYDASNTLVYTGYKVMYGKDQNGNCVNYRPANTATGIQTKTEVSQYVSVFPNPNNGEFSLEVSSVVDDKGQISLFDVLGRKIDIQSQYDIKMGVQTIDLAFKRKLPSGIYLLNFKTKLINESKRFVIE